jgi:hypothetical protein
MIAAFAMWFFWGLHAQDREEIYVDDDGVYLAQVISILMGCAITNIYVHC